MMDRMRGPGPQRSHREGPGRSGPQQQQQQQQRGGGEAMNGVYLAQVVQQQMERPPLGVFVQLLKRESGSGQNLEGKRALVRASSSAVVPSLKMGEVVRVDRAQRDERDRIQARLAPAKTWKQVEAPAAPPAPAAAAAGPAAKRVKPLLIVDLNGVLCDRGSFADRNGSRPGRGQGKQLRPDALEFLSWCFETFEVAVWSCGKRENMEMELFEGRTLVFAWDQTKSTSLWPRTSAVSADKPLFLKELGKVWDVAFQVETDSARVLSWRAQPTHAVRTFGPRDTILLDNHAEKFERNPVGVGVLVATWTKDLADDRALSADGPLRALLASMSNVPDVAAFGQLAALDTLQGEAPLAYVPGAGLVPKPPVAASEGASDDPRTPSGSDGGAPKGGAPPAVFPGGAAPPPAADTGAPPPHSPRVANQAANPRDVARALLEAYCASSEHRRACPEYTPDRYLSNRDSPGPRARPLRRRDLPLLGLEGYAVTEKTDGERAWLFSTEKLGAAASWLVKRDLSLAAALPGLGAVSSNGPTLLDGEMLPESKTFVVFDAVRCDGVDVGADGSGGAPKRLETAAKHLGLAGDGLAVGDWRVLAKRYWTAADPDLRDVAVAVAEKGAFADASRTNRSDGLVLTKTNDSAQAGYYASTCYKFKPVITLDVKLLGVRRFLDEHGATSGGKTGSSPRQPHNRTNARAASPLGRRAVDAAVAGDRGDLVVASVLVPDDKFGVLRKASRDPIAECVYEDGDWRLVKLRPDKRKPNSIRTAWAVLESVADRLTVADVVDAMTTTDVARHYDLIQLRRNAHKPMDDAMYRLRRLNNFAKALAIDAAAALRFLRHLASSSGGTTAPRATSAEVLAALRAEDKGGHKRAGRAASQHRATRASVVELGCGRGGDLGKWRSQVAVSRLVAVDISAESIKEAERRWTQMAGPGSGTFKCCDFAAPGFKASLLELLDSKPADLCACHFALHYALGDSKRCGEFLDAVASSLVDGGIFVATVVDWRALRDLLRTESRAVGDLCRVQAPDPTLAALDALPDDRPASSPDDALGLAYDFTLGDAVEDCREFVTHTPTLAALAADRGLTLVGGENGVPFPAFLGRALARDPTAFSRLASDIGVRPNPAKDKDKASPLTDDQFNVAGLYAVLLFRKGLAVSSQQPARDDGVPDPSGAGPGPGPAPPPAGGPSDQPADSDLTSPAVEGQPPTQDRIEQALDAALDAAATTTLPDANSDTDATAPADDAATPAAEETPAGDEAPAAEAPTADSTSE